MQKELNWTPLDTALFLRDATQVSAVSRPSQEPLDFTFILVGVIFCLLNIVRWRGVYHTQHGAQKAKDRVVSEMRKQMTDKHVKGKGYKTISEQLNDPVTKVAHVIQKFKVHGTVLNLPGRGCQRKIDDILKGRIIQMVTKEPRTTSKEIRGELCLFVRLIQKLLDGFTWIFFFFFTRAVVWSKEETITFWCWSTYLSGCQKLPNVSKIL